MFNKECSTNWNRCVFKHPFWFFKNNQRRFHYLDTGSRHIERVGIFLLVIDIYWIPIIFTISCTTYIPKLITKNCVFPPKCLTIVQLSPVCHSKIFRRNTMVQCRMTTISNRVDNLKSKAYRYNHNVATVGIKKNIGHSGLNALRSWNLDKTHVYICPQFYLYVIIVICNAKIK